MPILNWVWCINAILNKGSNFYDRVILYHESRSESPFFFLSSAFFFITGAYWFRLLLHMSQSSQENNDIMIHFTFILPADVKRGNRFAAKVNIETR